MPNGDGGGSFDFGSFFDGLFQFLADAINAIIQFLNDLVSAIVQALNFLLSSDQGIFGFSFASLSEVWNGLKKLTDAIFKNIVLAALTKLYDLYKKLKAWATKLKAWLDRLHALMQKYQMMYFRKIIQIIQRARKILTIFRFFHLKFAQKLDNWLATIEGKITHYLLLVAQKENEVIAWVDFIVDPLGHLKTFPLLRGFFQALDATWSGLFGTTFTSLFNPTPGPPQTATQVTVTFPQTVADARTGTGDGGIIRDQWARIQTAGAQEMYGG